jgi:hypothetical protein
LIPFHAGWLAVIHETDMTLGSLKRSYQHRFVWFDRMHRLRGISRRFIFRRPGIEFAAGMAWHPDGKRLMISFGVQDREAWIATVNASDVRALMGDPGRITTAVPGTLALPPVIGMADAG